MTLITLRLLFDFGLVVLIWLVQLIIYPTFSQIASTNLVRWHKRYTTNLGFVVIPLMFGQLGVSIWQVFLDANLFTITSLFMVVSLWAITFVWFVPLHNAVASSAFSERLAEKLVMRNWLRTFLWTLLFVLDIFYLNM